MPPHAVATQLGPATAGKRAPQVLAALVDRVPAFLVLALASTTGLTVLADALGLRPLAAPWSSRIVLVTAVGLAVVLVRLLAPQRRASGSALAAVPAGVLVVYALFARALALGDRAEWFIGGDHVRHLLYVAEIPREGALSYGVNPYPRGWHALVATVWESFGGRRDPDGFASLLDLLSTATWLLPAVLSISTASLAVALAHRLRLGDRATVGAALVGGAGVLLPSYLTWYQSYGFENSYVAGIVAAVCLRAVVDTDRGWGPVVVTAAGVVVMGHAWQLMMPLSLLALAATSWRLLREDRSARTLGTGAVVWLTAALAALPAVRAVFVVVGVGHAAVSGVRPPVPLLLLAVTVLALAALAILLRRDRLALLALAMVLLPALTAGALCVRLGIPLTDYYPGKLVWHTAALGPAVVAVVVAAGLRALAARDRLTRPVGGVVAVLAAMVLIVALVTPAGAFTGHWSTADGRRVVAAVTTSDASEADVVWLGSAGSDTMTRILLIFYGTGPASRRADEGVLDVADECALLAASNRPTVLSDRPEPEVRARYGCAPGFRLVAVRLAD